MSRKCVYVCVCAVCLSSISLSVCVCQSESLALSLSRSLALSLRLCSPLRILCKQLKPSRHQFRKPEHPFCYFDLSDGIAQLWTRDENGQERRLGNQDAFADLFSVLNIGVHICSLLFAHHHTIFMRLMPGVSRAFVVYFTVNDETDAQRGSPVSSDISPKKSPSYSDATFTT